MERIDLLAQRGRHLPVYFRPRDTEAVDSLKRRDVEKAINATNRNVIPRYYPNDVDRVELTKKGSAVVGKMFGTNNEVLGERAYDAPDKYDERGAIKGLLDDIQYFAEETNKITEAEKAGRTYELGATSAQSAAAGTRGYEQKASGELDLFKEFNANDMEVSAMNIGKGLVPVAYIPKEKNSAHSLVAKDVEDALQKCEEQGAPNQEIRGIHHIQLVKDGDLVVSRLFRNGGIPTELRWEKAANPHQEKLAINRLLHSWKGQLNSEQDPNLLESLGHEVKHFWKKPW